MKEKATEKPFGTKWIAVAVIALAAAAGVFAAVVSRQERTPPEATSMCLGGRDAGSRPVRAHRRE